MPDTAGLRRSGIEAKHRWLTATKVLENPGIS